MRFQQSPIPGVTMVVAEPVTDERGYFVRFFSTGTFADAGIDLTTAVTGRSYNARVGTLRGMHFQVAPFEEAKLVRCARGRMFDVAIDLRPESPTYCEWFGIELSADAWTMLSIPPGCAHGFVTLEDETEVEYHLSNEYSTEHARGVRWDDPCFAVDWPIEPSIISARDLGYRDFSP